MAGTEAAQPEDLRRMHEALGVRLFTPPPEGFDPVQASDRELLVYGYPGRPDARLHPDLHDHWTQLMSRPMTVIQPEFAGTRGRGHGPPLRYAPPLPAGYGWAGSRAYAGDGEAFGFVTGQWTVPAVALPEPGLGGYACATWIGIDGAGVAEDASGDILQAGTTQWIADEIQDENGLAVAVVTSGAFAWSQWYPDDPVTVANLTVSPGDVMYCVICVHTPTAAGVHLANLTTGVLAPFIKTTADQRLVGDTAEWILESPWVDGGGPGELARYGEVYFDNCVAATSGGALHFAGTSALIPMLDVNGATISTPKAVTNTLITVTYTASR